MLGLVKMEDLTWHLRAALASPLNTPGRNLIGSLTVMQLHAHMGHGPLPWCGSIRHE